MSTSVGAFGDFLRFSTIQETFEYSITFISKIEYRCIARRNGNVGGRDVRLMFMSSDWSFWFTVPTKKNSKKICSDLANWWRGRDVLSVSIISSSCVDCD